MKIKSIRIITVLTVVTAIFAGGALLAPANAVEVTRYITVSATGTTTVVPDAVRVSATVSVLGKSSKEALASAGTTSTEIRKALVANKIATKDVASQSISVNPEYTYPNNGTPVLSGYRATQSFTITVRAAATARTHAARAASALALPKRAGAPPWRSAQKAGGSDRRAPAA